MKKIYICSPFRGKDESEREVNIKLARKYCRFAMNSGKDVLPIAPHLYFPQFLNDNDEAEREAGINVGIELLVDCDEIWVFGKFISEGMARELEEATSNFGITVRWFDENCKEREGTF